MHCLINLLGFCPMATATNLCTCTSDVDCVANCQMVHGAKISHYNSISRQSGLQEIANYPFGTKIPLAKNVMHLIMLHCKSIHECEVTLQNLSLKHDTFHVGIKKARK